MGAVFFTLLRHRIYPELDGTFFRLIAKNCVNGELWQAI